MKTIIKTLKITNIEKLNNSIYGNPKRKIYAIDENGNEYIGNTKTNGAIGYLIDYYSINRKYIFNFHYTNNGNLIFDYAKNI